MACQTHATRQARTAVTRRIHRPRHARLARLGESIVRPCGRFCYVVALLLGWEREYLGRTSGHRDIVHFDANDLTYSYDATTVSTPTDNRLVAVWGRSGTQSGPRNALRMRGYPSPNAKSAETPLDRGHALAHSAGGSEEGINLIPQNRYLNRGWSPEGKEWTRLERQLAATLGTPFFVRPIYSDKLDFPAQIEFGVQQSDDTWDSHIFQTANRTPRQHLRASTR
jgi:hypothetical protein